MKKIKEKLINTFSYAAKASAIILLFVVAAHSCSDSMVQLKQDTDNCQCGCSCITDTLSCKQCKETIRIMIREEVDKQLTEVFD